MRSAIIDKRLRYLEQLFIDVKEVQDDINTSYDPALRSEYEEEMEVLFTDLEEHAQDVLYLLTAYFDDCKEQNYPIVLEYYKIFKELQYAKRLKLLHLE